MTQAVLGIEPITESRTLHVALELSSSKWLLAFSDGSSTKPKIHQIDAGDVNALDKKIAAVRKAYRLATGPVVSCYEAGRDGFWIHRMLEARGIRNTVVDPATLARGRVGRSPKTDKLDAVALVQMLVRAERGERGVWTFVRVPTEEQEDPRRLARYRHVLMVECGQHGNRIASLLLTVGVKVDYPQRTTLAHLAGLKQWNGTPLPSGLVEELELEIQRLVLVRAQLAALDKKLKVATELDPLSKKLMSLKGVGEKSARILSTECGWRDFRNGREVGAFAGLVGTPFRSGSLARDQGISKAGNRRVRRVMVELAWFWVKHQPTSELTKWFHARIGAKPTSRQKRVAVVALARKLLVALWRCMKYDVIPAGAELKAA
jgi:transposase